MEIHSQGKTIWPSKLWHEEQENEDNRLKICFKFSSIQEILDISTIYTNFAPPQKEETSFE